MNRLAIALSIALIGIASIVHADDPNASAPPPDSPTADLIEAAKGARERRKKSSTKVITNADVKKSKGKLIQKKSTTTVPVSEGPSQSTIEVHAANLAATKAAEKRLSAAEERVATLSQEMAAIELSYYEESDLDRRDREIVARFADAKRRMAIASAELEEARRALHPQAAVSEQVAGDPNRP